jgi:hypothetical protein
MVQIVLSSHDNQSDRTPVHIDLCTSYSPPIIATPLPDALKKSFFCEKKSGWGRWEEGGGGECARIVDEVGVGKPMPVSRLVRRRDQQSGKEEEDCHVERPVIQERYFNLQCLVGCLFVCLFVWLLFFCFLF